MSDSPGAGPSRRTPSPPLNRAPHASATFTTPGSHALTSSARDAKAPLTARRAAPFPNPVLGIPRVSSPVASGSSSPNTPLTASSSGSGSRTKRRPRPLVLDKTVRDVGQDEERSAQLDMDGLNTARSGITIITGDDSDGDVDLADGRSDISQEIDNLSSLRRDVQANLRERPLDSPLSHTTSDTEDRSRTSSPNLPLPPLIEQNYISLSDLHPPSSSEYRHLILDIRPLESYLASHLPGSIHLAIPSLLYKRYRRYTQHHESPIHGIDMQTLAAYITPQSERPTFEARLTVSEVDIVLVTSGESSTDVEAAQVYKTLLGAVVSETKIRILRGGWTAVQADKAVLATVDSNFGQSDDRHRALDVDTGAISGLTLSEIDKAHPPPKSAPLRSTLPTFNIAPPPVPSDQPLQLPQKQSMPSLRSGMRRKVPALSIQTATTGAATTGAGIRPPKLSLNLDKPTRSNTTGQYDLRLNITSPAAGGPSRTPIRHSSQPDGTGGTSVFSGELRNTPSIADSASPTATGTWAQSFPRSPSRNPQADSEPPQTAALPTARNAIAPFIVSTILPSFLYLGPEITSQAEIQALKDMGIQRILNVALECEDDQGLGLGKAFDKYTKIPMRDIVEETGVNGYMRDACDLLDDARLHSAPVYVHCKAGKSRSVTVVLAYLIHANAWTLKTAYAYVAERRRGISPNIGFVSELMQFEERELGIKQSGGVHGETSQSQSKNGEGGHDKSSGRANAARGSLPAAWVAGPSSSVDARPPGGLPLPSNAHSGGEVGGDTDATEGKARTVRDEREVMKNGQWVQ